PAAYCGVVGFKGTYGLIPTDGVVPLAWSFDHVGVFARRVADVALALDVLAPPAQARTAPRPPRLALAPELLERASPEVAALIRETAARFARAGATVEEVALPPSFAGRLTRPAVAYARAQRARLGFRREVMPRLAACDALLSPTAPTPAPEGLGATGDPWFCAPWSFAGVPAISLPIGVSSLGLP